MLSAVLWDVDGTLAETERDGHRVAFNQAFEVLKLPWRWSPKRYGELLHVAGGRERILHDMATQPDVPARPKHREALARRLHALKSEYYVCIVRDQQLPLSEGVRELVDDCLRADLPMGIVTTTSRVNVEALLSVQLGTQWRQWFDVLVCGEDASNKKPHPQAYQQALAQLKLHPAEVLAIEDSPLGVRSATAAGVPVVVTRSHYFRDDLVDGAMAVGPSFGQRRGWQPGVDAPSDWRVGLGQLRVWHSALSYRRHI